MPPRAEWLVPGLALAWLVAISGCTSEPARREVGVGHHRVSLVVPRGWEHLDHGRQQLFRAGTMELMLEDLGPATGEGLASALRAAESLWVAERRLDAFARVRELQADAGRFPRRGDSLEFWKPWTEATGGGPEPDPAAVSRAFRVLRAAALALPEVPTERLLHDVLADLDDAPRREVARMEPEDIHGSAWVVADTWDGVSHLYGRRFAAVEDGGCLLLLSMRRTEIGRAGAAFDSLLSSVEFLPRP